jgi:hypothetical protein
MRTLEKVPRGCAAARCRRWGYLGRIARRMTRSPVGSRRRSTRTRGAPRSRRPVIHRLNRAGYANAVRIFSRSRSTFARCCRPTIRYGFDNISDVLSLSPALLERYMTAAGKISRLAVGDAEIRPAVQTYSVPQTLLQRDRISEAQPFGTRGGAAVRHYFPDGE